MVPSLWDPVVDRAQNAGQRPDAEPSLGRGEGSEATLKRPADGRRHWAPATSTGSHEATGEPCGLERCGRIVLGRLASSTRGCETSRVAAGEIVGRWRLVSLSAQTDGGEVAYPFGQQPEGSAVLTAGGWMTGMLAVRDRPNLSTDDLVLASEEERALAFSTYIAYCGTYEIDGDVLITRVAMSMFPNWVGGEQKRYFELSGDELVLRTLPVQVRGDVVVNEVRWVREE